MVTMKKAALLLLCIIIFPVTIFAQQIDSLNIHSKVFGAERKILIYTPWEYNNVPNSRFEVIYVFDAQAREYFDNVHSTLAFLNNSQFPMIVVGIVSEERNRDFLPKNEFPETYKHFGGYLGNADKFLNFISNELVPFIDTNYRTLPKRIAIAHSNGATFLMYCLTQKPELFDAYLAISPNWAYDKEQPVRRLAQFDLNRLRTTKFIYMCNANEGNQWKDWVPAREKAIALLKTDSSSSKIIFENQDFSATENHTTVFPIAVFYGLKKYLNYQFFDASNLIAYYTTLMDKKLIDFTPDQLNQIAYDFSFNGKTKEAIKILLWANTLFPENLNLYDSLGEMYENSDSSSKAMSYYTQFREKLEQQKKVLTTDEYNKLKKGNQERIQHLENSK